MELWYFPSVPHSSVQSCARSSSSPVGSLQWLSGAQNCLQVGKLVEYPDGRYCGWQWNEFFGESSSFEIYVMATIFVFTYIPLLVIALLYLVILVKLKTQKIPVEQLVNGEEQRAKRERNVLKMSIAIVLVFAVSFLPLSIFWSVFLFSSNSTLTSSCGFQYLEFVVIILFNANCAINPWICCIFSGNYRQGLKTLFR